MIQLGNDLNGNPYTMPATTRASMNVNFVDDRHALYAGWVLGLGMRNGVHCEPVIDDDGNYTDRLIIPFGSQVITLVVPPPPDDWSLESDTRNAMFLGAQTLEADA